MSKEELDVPKLILELSQEQWDSMCMQMNMNPKSYTCVSFSFCTLLKPKQI